MLARCIFAVARLRLFRRGRRRAGQDRPHGVGDRARRRRSAFRSRTPATLLPTRIGDATVEYIQLEDGGDTTRAVQNVEEAAAGAQRRRADRAVDDAERARDPRRRSPRRRCRCMATVGTSSVVEPMDAKRRWVFKTTQNDDLIAAALVKHMVKSGVKTIGFIGFKDPVRRELAQGLRAARREGRHHGRRDRALRAHRSRASPGRR